MENIVNKLNSDPKIVVLAFLLGIIPSFIWLWFWLKEDKKNPEPKGVLTSVFILGMITVPVVILIQQFIKENIDVILAQQFIKAININTTELRVILFAGAEELIKYLAVIIILFHTTYVDEPIDWPIYLITAALGFAALENILYMIQPLGLGQTIELLGGNLRFFGATLLHAVASGIFGIILGFSFYRGVFRKELYFFIGLIFATALHSIFNLFIINNYNNKNILGVYVFLWIVAIIVMLLFEKLKRISN
ncbi:MAG: PrsW family glutamic-type intramembrane protease [Patescibacteria group bacterium]